MSRASYLWMKRTADIHRTRLGSSQISETAERVLKILKDSNVPVMLVGGYAVQHHGFFGNTVDIDIVVHDRSSAIDILSMRGFKEKQGNKMTITDRANGVEVDVLQAGQRMTPNSLPNPEPVGDMIEIEPLVSGKLSSYLASPGQRLKDAAHVAELIKARALPRNFVTHPSVQAEYHRLWDQIQRDPKVEH